MRCKAGMFTGRVSGSYTVSGAGTSATNGTYDFFNTTNGKNAYKRSGQERYLWFGTFLSELARSNENVTGWILSTVLNASDYTYVDYFVETTDATPPLTGWEIENGNSPAPTLSQ